MEDIKRLTLSEVRAAIALGKVNLDAVTPEFKPELEVRLAALEERKIELQKRKAAMHRNWRRAGMMRRGRT